MQAAHDPQGHRIRPAGASTEQALSQYDHTSSVLSSLFSIVWFLGRDDAVIYLAHYLLLISIVATSLFPDAAVGARIKMKTKNGQG